MRFIICESLLTLVAASFLVAPAAAGSSCFAEMYRTRITVNNSLAQHSAAVPFAPESNSNVAGPL